MGDKCTYRVVQVNHDKDQNEEGTHLTPFWFKLGREVVCRGMTESDANQYATRLQRIRDAATAPFRFTTYLIETEYPESPV